MRASATNRSPTSSRRSPHRVAEVRGPSQRHALALLFSALTLGFAAIALAAAAAGVWVVAIAAGALAAWVATLAVGAVRRGGRRG
jgi:hypothetical protein